MRLKSLGEAKKKKWKRKEKLSKENIKAWKKGRVEKVKA